MDSEAWGTLCVCILLGSLILVPIYLRNRLLARQLDALTVAMQHGIEPERVRESMLLRKDEGDANGNWKAGRILMALGWTHLPFGALGVLAALGEADAGPEALAILLPGIVCLVIGAQLLRIHRTVIGEVVRRTEPGAASVKTTAGPEPVA